MTTISIRTPGNLNFSQQRIALGDTYEFVEKLNGTQSKLEVFSSEVISFVADLKNAVNVIDQIAGNAASVAANNVVSDLTQIRNQIQQISSSTENLLSNLTELYDQKYAALTQHALVQTESIQSLSEEVIQTMQQLESGAQEHAQSSSSSAQTAVEGVELIQHLINSDDGLVDLVIQKLNESRLLSDADLHASALYF